MVEIVFRFLADPLPTTSSITDQDQMVLQTVDFTSRNSPEGVSESQHHVSPDPDPDIL